MSWRARCVGVSLLTLAMCELAQAATHEVCLDSKTLRIVLEQRIILAVAPRRTEKESADTSATPQERIVEAVGRAARCLQAEQVQVACGHAKKVLLVTPRSTTELPVPKEGLFLFMTPDSDPALWLSLPDPVAFLADAEKHFGIKACVGP